jgi:hypothetical protein
MDTYGPKLHKSNSPSRRPDGQEATLTLILAPADRANYAMVGFAELALPFR